MHPLVTLYWRQLVIWRTSAPAANDSFSAPFSLNPPMGFPGGRSGVVWGWWAGWFRCLGWFSSVIGMV